MPSIFYVEYLISSYEPTIAQGVFSTLEKAVEYCQETLKNERSLHTEDPFEKNGYVIFEFLIDDATKPLKCKSYNDEGKLMTQYNPSNF